MSKLSDFISIKHGFAFKGEFITTEENANCLITPVNFSIGGGFKSDKFKYYTGEIPEKYILQPNDLIVTMTDLSKQADTLGYPALVPNISGKKMLHNQRIGLVEFLNNELDKEYLYFLMRTKEYRHQILSTATGATVHHTSPSKILDFEFEKPDLQTQKLIAQYLMILEEKIQLNTQINQTLEAIAQAIFKSWFVDFDPVRAKAQALSEGKSEHEANLAAMSVICGKDTSELNDTEYKALWEIADAFPSELVENAEFGEVPKGWERSTIGESYNVIMGQSPSGETYNEQGNGTLFYQGRAEFGWRFPTPRLFTTNPKRMAKSNDILMSVRAPVGDLNVALENCCIGRGLCALSHKSGEFSFGFYQMKNLKSVLDVFNGEGTVFGSINQKDLKSIPVLNPHQEIIALFNKFIFDIDNKIKNNVKENQQLEKIRDLLLPKLLSGELLNE
ncbi:restriction endonuclease subunit S [Moraxella catarrhalis]|uniref:restriction endonuclease subunit S n=1 Tax=Moraxella catarrhalis TaxID=480 RepID=UPI00128BD3EB|nr:restriction endonuclease subunit S [Moraxella catarrhalis]MPX82544.1 restriction endonuclease subunit S [Moraxella catarrhalis]